MVNVYVHLAERITLLVQMQGQYASDADFATLAERMAEGEAPFECADRLFYLSIPPNIFTAVAASASKAASSK